MPARWLASLVLLYLVLFNAPSLAFAEDKQPSLELLEFLADWETDDGQWIDPTGMDDLPLPEEKGSDDDSEDDEKSS